MRIKKARKRNTVLSLRELEKMGGLIQPTGHKPKSSLGSTLDSRPFRVAYAVLEMAATRKISKRRAQAEISAEEGIPFETVRTYTNRFNQLASAVLNVARSMGGVDEVRRRLYGCPDDVFTWLAKLPLGDLLRVLRLHSIDFGPPSWFLNVTRTCGHLGPAVLLRVLESFSPSGGSPDWVNEILREASRMSSSDLLG